MMWKLSFVMAVCAAALTAQVDVLTTFDNPSGNSQNIEPLGINDAGDIVGYYVGAGNKDHGFLLSQGKFTDIDFPGATSTRAWKINSRGDIVGTYSMGGTTPGGFLLSQGKFTPLACPGAKQTLATAINSAGDIAGWILPESGPSQGFLIKGGVCTVSEYRPDVSRRIGTLYSGLNDAGVLVGYWGIDTGTIHGLVYSKGAFTQVDHGGGGYTWPLDINNAGDIVGQLYTSDGIHRAFLMSRGRFTIFDLPGATSSSATGINSSGQIIGHYRDAGTPGQYHGYVARVTPSAPPPPVLMVDDDGVDSPGALGTIQEAVARAVPGSTILVYPGTYRRTVNIVGPEKEGLRLIAVGGQNEVVLQGDYTERDGFHLENVSNVVIRGFTVRDFGNKLTSADQWGVGNQIYLQNAHYNTIEQNQLFSGDMVGIMLVDSGSNTVQNNFTRQDLSVLATSGITLQGAKSAGNTIRSNFLFNNKMAGITVRGAGPGNQITDNTILANGRYGIDVEDTSEIQVEGNRVSYGRGFWGSAMPGGKQEGRGINLVNVTKATVFDNRARGNPGGDLMWDGKGENKLETNACETSTPAGACGK